MNEDQALKVGGRQRFGHFRALTGISHTEPRKRESPRDERQTGALAPNRLRTHASHGSSPCRGRGLGLLTRLESIFLDAVTQRFTGRA